MGACLTFAGCAAIRPDGQANCLVAAAGDFDNRFDPPTLFQPTLDHLVDRALDAASLTTDFRLNDQLENCRKLVGFRVYTKPTWNFMVNLKDSKDGITKVTSVSGYTECWGKYIVVGTPLRAGRTWWSESSVVHELFHAMQHCESPPPTDPGYDDDHSNWYRDGIFSAIDYERSQP